jgi:thioredoxin reductase (NADPH)
VENLIIVGSGPAGLTAAIYAARARLNPLMIEGEEAGGQLMLTTEVENYPGFEDGITGPELMEKLKKQAVRFGTRIISRNVIKVDFSKTSGAFELWDTKQSHQSKAVIISTGASAKYLGLPSEKQYMNRGVSACATCDGAFFKDVEVAVVGGGDTAMEEAQFLTRFARKVYVIHRREVIEVLGDGKKLSGLKIKNIKTSEVVERPMGGLFLAIGHKPNTEVFKPWIETNETGYIKTKPGSSYTNVPGVFAAGDVQDPTYRQAITAAGSGCMAAIDTERWLEAQGH